MLGNVNNRTHSEIRKAMEAGQASARMGTIDSYDPATHMAKVMIQPEAILTGWMPLHTAYVGNGFGFYVGPNIGDQVTVIHQEGNPGSGIIMGRVNDDQSVPPNVPSGEAHLIHSSLSFLKFTNDGNVSLNTHQDFVVTTTGKLNATCQGDADITTQGNANVTAQAINLGSSGGTLMTLLMHTFKAFFNAHVHGSSAPPTTPLTDSYFTTVVKAD